MSHRFLVSLSVLTITIAAVFLAGVPAAAQAGSAAAAKVYTPARTPDGQPDLQGFWTNSTYTPLERPNGVTKEFYTEQEAADAERRAAERETEQTEPGTIADVHYDFSQFGLDRNQSRFSRNLRTSLIVDPRDGKIPSLSPEGEKRAAENAEAAKRKGGRWDSAQSNDLDDRCLIMLGSGPPMLPTGYNSNYQIVQTPGYVMILVEMIHDVRIIPLDGRPHVSHSIRQWMGDSRGHWEGDTLVVETTNFNGKNPLRGSSENMRVTERFTRMADDTILYKFTIDDASTWVRPWSAEIPMKKTVGPIFEHACHEGNYGLYNTLVGARAEEKAAAEAAKKGSK
jgi:hypothetical protein